MPTPDEKVLVIGATGNVGRHLIDTLAERDASVRAATRSPDAYEGPPQSEAVRFDYNAPDTFAPALEGADRVFVMAPADTDGQVVPFIDAAKDAGVQHVVLMTALGVDQAPDEVPLRRAELYLQDAGLAHTILRPNWFMQNFLSYSYWRGMIEHGGTIRLPAADAETSFVDAEDVAAVAAVALTEDGHAGRAYTPTGPGALTYHEATDVLSEASGREIRYEPVSDDEAHRILPRAGLDADYAQQLVGLFQNVKAGHAAPVTPDVEQVTGWAPRSLEQFAHAHAEAWR